MVRSPESPVLSISGLVKDVGPLPTLDGKMLRVVSGLSLVAERGQVTALLGANGAGKTTTIECAQGLQKRTHGSISLLGEDPDTAGAGLRSRVGVMLQDGGLPPSARPIPLLKHIAGMYQNPWPVGELIDRLGIGAFSRTSVRRRRPRPGRQGPVQRDPWQPRPPPPSRRSTPKSAPGTAY